MPITLPEKCLRNLNDCNPLAQICSDNGNSFICCGKNDGRTRKIKQDEFRHCWVNSEIDELSDWDRRDISDTLSVLAQALSIDANINSEYSEKDNQQFLILKELRNKLGDTYSQSSEGRDYLKRIDDALQA